MLKSYVQELLGVIECLLEDIRYSYPALAGELDRDIIRLRRSAEQRGLHFLVVTLPELGKHLDKCLACGQYKSSRLPLTKRVSAEVRVPKFLRALYLLIFEGSGRLRDDYDVEAILFLRQILYVGKKAKIHCGEEAVAAARLQFFDTDMSLPVPERVWESSNASVEDFRIYSGFKRSELYGRRVRDTAGVVRPVMLAVLEALDFVSAQIASALGPYDPRDWRFRHGPGVVSTSPKWTSKYNWTSWPSRLENVFPIADYGYHNYASWAGNVEWWKDGSEEPVSRLIDVPKTFLKPRLIAAEPGQFQWCQQNIWHYFRTRCDRTWISMFVRFRDQTRNQELCRRGSVTGDLVTLDLSEASDRVTCHAVGQMFRTEPKLLHALQATRTLMCSSSKSPSRDADPQENALRLRKFATMGNACTFPVESLIFLTVALAACLVQRRLQVTMRSILGLAEEVAVFGDDIVVPTDCWELVVEALEVLHFKVNTDKSFCGRSSIYGRPTFRESCGVDSFGGVDVTPTYWRYPCTNNPESIASTAEVANSFMKKFFIKTSRRIASTIRSVKLPDVPMDSGTLGLMAYAPSEFRGKTRYNEALHRPECLLPVLVTRQEKTPAEDDTALLQYFTERPDPMNNWKSGVAQRPKLKIQLRWVPFEDLQ